MPPADMGADELLTTTRSVRKRLDLTRPVERGVIEECLSIATQAPNGSNKQDWHFVVVSDADKRAGLAAIYRRGAEAYLAGQRKGDGPPDPSKTRFLDSYGFLVDHMHEVPIHVIPCIYGRTDGQPVAAQAAKWASIVPAAWSFMLALHARGLGTTFTISHLRFEEEAAALLGIPYDRYMQTMLMPVAYVSGEGFRRGVRRPISTALHWDSW